MATSIAQLISAWQAHHTITQVWCKTLRENDNVKNQLYLGAHLPKFLQHLSSNASLPSQGGSVHRHCVVWRWGVDTLEQAPHACVIARNRHMRTEWRLSGFSRNCSQCPPLPAVPKNKRQNQAQGYLLVGTTASGECCAHVVALGSALAASIEAEKAANLLPVDGVFVDFSVHITSPKISPQQWIALKKMKPHLGVAHPVSRRTTKGVHKYDAHNNAAGLTWESLCGVPANSACAPDLHSGELKTIKNNVVTLITPAPTQGTPEFFRKGRLDLQEFLRTCGYIGQGGKWRFSDPCRVGVVSTKTNTKVEVQGWNASNKTMQSNAQLVMVFANTKTLAWPLEMLINHMCTKYAQGVYVVKNKSADPAPNGTPQVQYAPCVDVYNGLQTDRFVEELLKGHIYLDLGCSFGNNKGKSRFQFRCTQAVFKSLFAHTTTVDTTKL